MTKIIDKFRDEYLFLSNYYLVDVEYKGITYPHTEAAFHAQKVFDDETKRKFQHLAPTESKRYGHKIPLRSDWNYIRRWVMYDVCLAKFQQHDDLKAKLLATGDATLIEGNTWNDKYWGVCNGKGRNELGKILMKVRETLRD